MPDNDPFEVMSSETAPGVRLEIVQYRELKGSDDLATAEKVFFANRAGIYLKQIRAILENGEVLIEPGALHYMRGALQLQASTQSLSRGLMRKFLTGETLFQSRIKGTGEVYLDPTFGHFALFHVDNDSLIVDKGAFYCADAGLSVSGVAQRNVSSALFGGEGFFQTQIKGTGIVALVSPVPVEELTCYELGSGEKLFVDGNFTLMRTSTVTFRAEKSAKSLFRTLASGEGLLQTFEGPGVVWIAPTQGIYEEIKRTGIAGLGSPEGSMGTHT
jgi:uncharacterized protein (AIM24 family)